MQKNKTEIIPIIKSFLKKYSVSEAYLFGSYLENSKTAQDIDIGIILEKKGEFFDLYADLMKNIDYKIDLIPLYEKNMFNDLIKRDGLKIYG